MRKAPSQKRPGGHRAGRRPRRGCSTEKGQAVNTSHGCEVVVIGEKGGLSCLHCYVMGALILVLAGVTELWPARRVLLATGVAGGLFVVPANAALQTIGHKSIGAGGAVAIQNFFENLGMLAAVGIYTWSTGMGGRPLQCINARPLQC